MFLTFWINGILKLASHERMYDILKFIVLILTLINFIRNIESCQDKSRPISPIMKIHFREDKKFQNHCVSLMFSETGPQGGDPRRGRRTDDRAFHFCPRSLLVWGLDFHESSLRSTGCLPLCGGSNSSRSGVAPATSQRNVLFFFYITRLRRDVLEHISGCTRIVPPVTLYALGLNTLVYPISWRCERSEHPGHLICMCDECVKEQLATSCTDCMTGGTMLKLP
ncbi:unnamed protein product [Nesidiocoris tenuis]|uniref:Uncharacterized protein n=1 Tax=Nesidiocoris tenuis TaxID=355587 RepID=A0A6H5HXG6_9HEMI|nr:unnamed protein product [Nesidiocoris tenuis]